MVAANGLPPKVLIVHQFREDMIKDKQTLRPVPGVQLVIDADGFGSPELKTSVYNILVRDEPVEFGGIKLFYKQDNPLLEPADVIGLNPSPDLCNLSVAAGSRLRSADDSAILSKGKY